MEKSEDWMAMVSGKPFTNKAGDIRAQRQLVRQRTAQFNRAPTPGHLKRIVEQFQTVGAQCFIEPGVHFDFGTQMSLGERVYINANCVFLDAAAIVIEDDVMIGPACQFYTVSHPLDMQERLAGVMTAKPIRIKRGSWIGGGSIILPGITIGVGAVVGAGSVVTKDVKDGGVVKGNPAS